MSMLNSICLAALAFQLSVTALCISFNKCAINQKVARDPRTSDCSPSQCLQCGLPRFICSSSSSSSSNSSCFWNRAHIRRASIISEPLHSPHSALSETGKTLSHSHSHSYLIDALHFACCRCRRQQQQQERRQQQQHGCKSNTNIRREELLSASASFMLRPALASLQRELSHCINWLPLVVVVATHAHFCLDFCSPLRFWPLWKIADCDKQLPVKPRASRSFLGSAPLVLLLLRLRLAVGVHYAPWYVYCLRHSSRQLLTQAHRQIS